MGEDPGKEPLAIHDECGSGAFLRQNLQHLDHRIGGLHHRGFLAPPHDVADAKQEGTAEIASGMEAGEVITREAALLKQDHREGIAEGEHHGGAGGGGEIVRAGLLAHRDIEDDIARFGQGRGSVACEGDLFHAESR